MYTLFKTEDPENDTLTVGTSLPRKYMGVPPPPPPPHPPGSGPDVCHNDIIWRNQPYCIKSHGGLYMDDIHQVQSQSIENYSTGVPRSLSFLTNIQPAVEGTETFGRKTDNDLGYSQYMLQEDDWSSHQVSAEGRLPANIAGWERGQLDLAGNLKSLMDGSSSLIDSWFYVAGSFTKEDLIKGELGAFLQSNIARPVPQVQSTVDHATENIIVLKEGGSGDYQHSNWE